VSFLVAGFRISLQLFLRPSVIYVAYISQRYVTIIQFSGHCTRKDELLMFVTAIGENEIFANDKVYVGCISGQKFRPIHSILLV